MGFVQDCHPSPGDTPQTPNSFPLKPGASAPHSLRDFSCQDPADPGRPQGSAPRGSAPIPDVFSHAGPVSLRHSGEPRGPAQVAGRERGQDGRGAGREPAAINPCRASRGLCQAPFPTGKAAGAAGPQRKWGPRVWGCGDPKFPSPSGPGRPLLRDPPGFWDALSQLDPSPVGNPEWDKMGWGNLSQKPPGMGKGKRGKRKFPKSILLLLWGGAGVAVPAPEQWDVPSLGHFQPPKEFPSPLCQPGAGAEMGKA